MITLKTTLGDIVIELDSDKSSRIVRAELIPSGIGDPLLPADRPIPDAIDRVVLSQSAAERLKVVPGDRIDGSVTRRNREWDLKRLSTVSMAASRCSMATARWTG